MSFETIELGQQGPVAIISLNRPGKLNAINKTMLLELDAALDDIEKNDSVYTVVINGNGRAFCAGFDLQAGIEANRKGEEQWRVAIQYDVDVIMRFWHFSKPTIAVVQGYALAGGFELALACDMTVCEDNAVFGEPEVRFGSSIAALLLPWYTNPKRTKKMLLTGQDRMLAQEALNLGIVNEVVGEGEGLRSGLALAEEVALMDPDSVRMTKQAINQTYEIMGLSRSLAMGVDTAVKIEAIETPLRKQFNQIMREQGMKAALAWREQRLKQ
jgi:enoyl-CoA hydratase